MTSIKSVLFQRALRSIQANEVFRQNQDLSKELAIAQAEISRLKSLVTGQKSGDFVHHSVPFDNLPMPEARHLPNHNLSHLPVSETSSLPPLSEEQQIDERPQKKRKIVKLQDSSKIGTNMARFGQGIFKSPYPQKPKTPLVSSTSPLPGLPPRDVADVLLRQYRYTIHPTLPLVNWQVFHQQYEGVYRDGSLHNVPSAWSALLFAVFACGTLHRSWAEGQRYLKVSKSLIDLWTENFSLDHARAALLNCIFLVESNHKSAGWTWMGISVRMAFDIGLNCEAGSWGLIEEEMRRRVWWSIYACDW